MSIDVTTLAPQVECKFCGFVWTPRVPKPRACPECKKRHPIKTEETV